MTTTVPSRPPQVGEQASAELLDALIREARRRARRRRWMYVGAVVIAVAVIAVWSTVSSGNPPPPAALDDLRPSAEAGPRAVAPRAAQTAPSPDAPIMQFANHRAVLAPPRAADFWALGPTDVLDALDRFAASGSVELAVGRYTDLDYVALQPGGSTPVLMDRLVWVLIEKKFDSALVHVVDAVTGEELITFGGPGGATCAITPGAMPDRCGNP